MMNESNILLYETEEGKINVDVILKDDNIWLTQKNMTKVFDTGVDNMNLTSWKNSPNGKIMKYDVVITNK